MNFFNYLKSLFSRSKKCVFSKPQFFVLGIFVVIAILLLSSNIQIKAIGNTYYVATTGFDSNPGTEVLPFRTIQHAEDIVQAGETIIVLAGNYNERVNIRQSGLANKPITYQTQGIVITKGFDIQADYIILDGFEVTNTNTSGISIKGHYNQIINNYIHHLLSGGDNYGIILVGHWPEWGSIYTENTNNIVKGNRIEYTYIAGIQIMGTNNIIENNDISHILTKGDADGVRFLGKGHIIKGNYIHDIRKSEAGGDPHIDCFQTWRNAEDIIFENNFCYQPDNSMQGVMIEQIVAPVKNLTFKNNIFKMDADWYGPGINVFAKTDQEIIENIKIYNNTFIHTGKNGDQMGQQSIIVRRINGAYIKNNIIYEGTRPGIYTVDCTNLEKDHNLFYAADGDIRDTKAMHDVWLNPLFINFSNNDFHLSVNSPAINAGTDVGINTDKDGNPRIGLPDIGAYEYQGSALTYFIPNQYIEAELGTLTPPMQVINGYVSSLTSNSGRVSFAFNISETGNYKMKARILTPSVALSHNSFYVGLDNEEANNVDSFIYDVAELSAFTWEYVSLRGLNGDFSWAEYDPKIWNLTAGIHTFTFYGRESDTRLDQIFLEKIQSPTLYCGDGTCGSGESCQSCPSDCPTGSNQICC